jgi:hypothetical protein
MKVKPLDQITKKWQERASVAGGAYKDGVMSTTGWASATSAGKDNWAQGVQAAAANGSFEKGVNAAGDAAWQSGAANKGAARYPNGVQGAGPKFSAGFGKYASVLSSLTLPARFPKGNPQNVARVQAVVDALRRAKLGA